MAQMAQVGTERNTVDLSSASRQKSRNWCFTLNNYMEAEIKNICEGKYQYIFQEETGEEGTPHLQGTIILPQPQALSYMKKINRRAHWEITRNKFASINYCQKGETRTGMLYTNMNVPDLFGTNGTAQNDPRNPEEDIKEMIDNTSNELLDELLPMNKYYIRKGERECKGLE